MLKIFTLLMVCCLNLKVQHKNVEVVPVQVEFGHGMALKIIEETSTSLLTNPDQLFIRKQGATTPIWGEFEQEESKLLFYPRVPLVKGIGYELVNSIDSGASVLATFTLGETTTIKKTKVEAIYPLTSELPQNLLRVHIKFSRPMTPKVAHQFVQLVDLTDGSIEKNVFERMVHEFSS